MRRGADVSLPSLRWEDVEPMGGDGEEVEVAVAALLASTSALAERAEASQEVLRTLVVRAQGVKDRLERRGVIDHTSTAPTPSPDPAWLMKVQHLEEENMGLREGLETLQSGLGALVERHRVKLQSVLMEREVTQKRLEDALRVEQEANHMLATQNVQLQEKVREMLGVMSYAASAEEDARAPEDTVLAQVQKENAYLREALYIAGVRLEEEGEEEEQEQEKGTMG